MSNAITTYPITFSCGSSVATLSELVEIKDFPDLGGAPEMLEKTTMKDHAQTYKKGIQSMSALEFTANYNLDDYRKVMESANTHQLYCLEFGEDGIDGKFYWWGEHTAWIVGAGVNAIVDMRISCAPSTPVEEGTAPDDPYSESIGS